MAQPGIQSPITSSVVSLASGTGRKSTQEEFFPASSLPPTRTRKVLSSARPSNVTGEAVRPAGAVVGTGITFTTDAVAHTSGAGILDPFAVDGPVA